MSSTKKRKPRQQSVTMRKNADGTITIRSTGGFDLRQILPPAPKPGEKP